MNLEGSLDSFGLPDVFALLSSTGKSGGLQLLRVDSPGSVVRGVVWFREGRICGASSDITRASLVRRVVGSGVVDDFALRQAVQRVSQGGIGLARALLEAGSIDGELMRQAAADQVVDAVFDLLRWPTGEFGFDQTSTDLDDVGISLDHTRVLLESQSRVQAWAQLQELIPSYDSVLSIPVVLSHEPEVSRDEWALMALVDGRRRVVDLVELTGAGEFAVTTTLAHLVQRGLLLVRDPAQPDHVTMVERRLGMLAGVESAPIGVDPAAELVDHDQSSPHAGPGALGMTAAAALAAARAAQGLAPPGLPGSGEAARATARRDVVPARPEPYLPSRRPDHPEHPFEPTGQRPPVARPSVGASSNSSSLGSGSLGMGLSGQSVVHGATAHALGNPSALGETAIDGVIERDPGVNRSLLLRLIAGVRGL